MSGSEKGPTVSGPLRVFISYSRKDDDLRERFVIALSQLQRDGVIESWDDREITGGTEWAGKIDERLNAADLVFLLVSPDFLASTYCYDVEMKRALERHDKREARVIPIILRPCDWKTSPFAKLNALPRDGKPVVDWSTLDHAYLNVAQGLRSVAQEFTGIPKKASPVLPRGAAVRAGHVSKWIPASAVGLLLLGLAAWFWYLGHRQNEQLQTYIAQGNNLLNVGRYEDARQPFQQALRMHPASPQAELGVEIADLVASRSDAVAFQQRLTEMLKRWPNESHLRVLNGDSLLALGHPQKAALEYQKATELNPHLAEAYFRLGVIYDKDRKTGHSLAMYEKAVELSPYSTQYRNNLADAYFKHGEYDRAIAEYGHLDRFPLAALESGKINRLLGRLDQAQEEELTAIAWLSDRSIASSPENKLPWYFSGETEGVSIMSPNEKLCYARFGLSATVYLKGDANQAADNAKQALEACGIRSSHVKAVVRWELERTANERDDLKTRAESYCQRFLGE